MEGHTGRGHGPAKERAGLTNDTNVRYVPAGLAGRTGSFQVEVLGEMRDAVILPEPPFDPAGARMRS